MSVVYHGERFAGYRLVEVIGSTPQATTHRAVDPEGRTVAVRILDARPDALTRGRFLREWAIAGDLHHPHIVPMYDTGEAEGRLYIVMRYVRGGDLATLLAGGSPLDPDRAVALLAQVAAALDAAHAGGLVHGHLTPARILVEAGEGGEHAYLTGFGAETANPAEYAAPEQVDGGGVDARTDVYALGRILQHCLFSDPGRRLSAGLDEIVARAVARRREDRYPTATSFLAAARRAIAEPGYHDPAAAALRSRPSAPRPLWPWSPLVAASLLATVLAATTGVAIGVHHATISGASNTASATALARVPTQLLAPGSAAAPATPAPRVGASSSPTIATPPPAPAPDATQSVPVTTPAPAVHTPAPVIAISPPLSGGTLFYATVRNTGQTDLVAGASTLTDTAAAAIVSDGCAGVHLAPGGSCLVTVRVQPATPGSAGSVLSVPISDGRPVTFTLNGLAP
jgi:serine/threonine protein kinase